METKQTAATVSCSACGGAGTKPASSFSILRKLGFSYFFCASISAIRRRCARQLLGASTIVLEQLHYLRMLQAMGGMFFVHGRGRLEMRLPLESGLPLVVNVRRSSSDLAVFHEIFIQKQYSPALDFVDCLTGGTRLHFVVDAGANIGLATLLLKRRYPQAQVLAVEPCPDNFSCLTNNIAVNDLPSVSAVNKALWPRRQSLSLAKTGDGREWSFACVPTNHAAKSQAKVIEGITLAELLEIHGFPYVDFLKMDIEGGEHELLGDIAICRETLAQVKILQCRTAVLHGKTFGSAFSKETRGVSENEFKNL